jgi:hypothetical protein
LVNDRIGKSRPLFFKKQQRMSQQVSERERTAKIRPDNAEQDLPQKRSRFAGFQIPFSAQNGLDYVISHRLPKFAFFCRPTCVRDFLVIFFTSQYPLRSLIVSGSRTIQSQEPLTNSVFDIGREMQPPINSTFVSSVPCPRA